MDTQNALNTQLLMMLHNNPGLAGMLLGSQQPQMPLIHPSVYLHQQAVLQQMNIQPPYSYPDPISSVPPPPPPPVQSVPVQPVHNQCCPFQHLADITDPPMTSAEEEKTTVKMEEVEEPKKSDINFEMGSLPTTTYYPTHLMRGTKLQIPNGGIKKVEDLSSDDFLRCAAETNDVNVTASLIVSIKKTPGSVTVVFQTGPLKQCVSLKVQHEHPFFVLGKGWSSCDTAKTGDTYGLKCAQLEIDDVCIVLTKQPDETDECVTDIISAQKQFEESSKKAAIRESIAEIYYEQVSGRVSAPPERIISHPLPQKRRRTSENIL